MFLSQAFYFPLTLALTLTQLELCASISFALTVKVSLGKGYSQEERVPSSNRRSLPGGMSHAAPGLPARVPVSSWGAGARHRTKSCSDSSWTWSVLKTDPCILEHWPVIKVMVNGKSFTKGPRCTIYYKTWSVRTERHLLQWCQYYYSSRLLSLWAQLTWNKTISHTNRAFFGDLLDPCLWLSNKKW